ncbi:hypothetical protein [Methanolobus sp.]|jgi:hypothetical protein|uniref:hypothetical protein n=1 Tax=Methanolobus sp. TaxID=1874737 RepID=UPI0025D0E4E1|nr:hypothetical protein [Methanolobus sp.]
MTNDINRSKLAHLLEHWVEHNESHSKSFKEWSVKVRDAGYTELADDILQAEQKMSECSDLLKKARDKC